MRNKVSVILLSGLMLLATNLMAQNPDNPNCNGNDDPDLPCPLDNWVWLLVLATVVFALYYWHRNRRQEIITA